MRPTVLLLLLLIISCPCAAQNPGAELDFAGAEWIWHPDSGDGNAYLRRDIAFEQSVEKIDILITADDSYELRVNGTVVGTGADWQSPGRYEVLRPVARTNSTIAVRAHNSSGSSGVLCKLVFHLWDGSTKTIVSDATWLCTRTPGDGWDSGRPDPAQGWTAARSIGAYPVMPWGPVARESWETLRARLSERREIVRQAADPGHLPQYSAFKGQYARPEYADLYKSFLKLNPRTGLLEREGRVIRPFFTVYSQPEQDGGWTLNIPDLDFDLVEKDFARMKQAGINVQPRFWNWSELLNQDGTWKRAEKQPRGHGLPYFTYVFEIYDHFLDRAQAHGLYVNIEPSFYWGLHPEVIPTSYRGKILLYDDLWSAAGEAYAKILRYYSRRTVIVAAMVGEEDLVFDHCLDEPQMLAEFTRFLKKKYGAVSNLRREWTHGYDYSDRSMWSPRTVDGREVIRPEYPFVEGAFDLWNSWDDVKLPVFDYYRLADNPDIPLKEMPTHQDNLARDPVWIDFMEMKEQMLISRLNGLSGVLRSADPNHILYYSNAHDFNPAWHFLHCFDRGKLRWDVIGVGQHDSGLDPVEVPQWAGCREYVQNVASYGPYIGSTGAYPRGFACGEGEGGKTRQGTADYYPWWLADVVGGGGAFFHSYHWNHIAGRTSEKTTAFDDATIDRLGDFLTSIEDLPFTRRDDAQVLILRSKHAAYGMSAGYDFANTRHLASILYQLHVPFDILPDSDVAVGDFEQGKVNLGKYRFIFVPAQNQLLSSRTWQMLEDWISDPRFPGKRGLCLGLYQDQDRYFNPSRPSDVHPAFKRLTGVDGYSLRTSVTGSVPLRFARYFGRSAKGESININFPEGGEIGYFDAPGEGVERILDTPDGGSSVVVRNILNANPVYTCGFYLGLAYNPIWGMEKEQEPYNSLNHFYTGVLESAGIEPTVTAPDNIGIYIADGDSALLMKERFGKETDIVLRYKSPSCPIFEGATTITTADGRVELRDFRIGPYQTLVLRRVAGLTLTPEDGATSSCQPTADSGLECEFTGKGKISVTFELKPKTIYSVTENNELLKVFTSDDRGRHTLPLDLGDGSKPLRITVKPSRR